MLYDVIIVGGGASGLFAGASLPPGKKCLILERNHSPGIKLLMAGGGQCNLTHSGSIKEFLSHYGLQGKTIRSVLYSFNNQALESFFRQNGLPLTTREDGKIFPSDFNAHSVLHLLQKLCKQNNAELRCGQQVTGLKLILPASAENSSEIAEPKVPESPHYLLQTSNAEYHTKKVIIATGGCSYPTTGSDGSFFALLEALGIPLTPLRPALTPVFVQDYPFSELSGISFSPANLTIMEKQGKKIFSGSGDLLLTHEGFSGPLILNSSRYMSPGCRLQISYVSGCLAGELSSRLKAVSPGNSKNISTVLMEELSLPKRFVEAVLECQAVPLQKISQCSGKTLQQLAQAFAADEYTVGSLGGYKKAMVTTGGVSLSSVNLKSMESKQLPGLFIIGEALDVDGDTGGYNLQFAFSSAHLAAGMI